MKFFLNQIVLLVDLEHLEVLLELKWVYLNYFMFGSAGRADYQEISMPSDFNLFFGKLSDAREAEAVTTVKLIRVNLFSPTYRTHGTL